MRMQLYNSGSSPEVSVINLGRINKLFKTAYIVVSPQLASWYIQAEITWYPFDSEIVSKGHDSRVR